MFIHLSITLLLYASSCPLVARAFPALPAPNTNGVINKDSVPNFNLFNNLLPASSRPSDSVVSNAVGPSKKSPNVPISSTSATNVSPAAPPNTPAANLLLVPGFKS